jgi:protein-S-isoprenylcysteine O-methyltransferase Ste14
VATHPDQEVVTAGPYRLIRHPSYTGLLIAFLGVGIFLNNWLSLSFLLVPITVAVLYRIRKEEEVLLVSLGESYGITVRRQSV